MRLICKNPSPSPISLSKIQSKKRKLENPEFDKGNARIYKGADYKIIFPRLQRASFRRATAALLSNLLKTLDFVVLSMTLDTSKFKLSIGIPSYNI